MKRNWIVELLGIQINHAKNPRRTLSEDDVDSFMTAADRRPKYKPQRQANLRKVLRDSNPWRWRRLQADFRWAQKVLEKSGYDPEEIRWLLEK